MSRGLSSTPMHPLNPVSPRRPRRPALRLLGRALAPAIAIALLLLIGGSASTPAPDAPLDELGFMAGCWRGPLDDGVGGSDGSIEEYYSRPSKNMILGLTRYTRGGRTVDFEFTTIEQTDSGVVLTPHPKGVASVPFRMRRVEAGTVVWENAEHDFPQRIIYRRVSAEALIARIEGSTPAGERAREWRMARAACAG